MKNVFNLKILGVILILIFGILIFFSKTIYFYNVPTVSTVIPSKGRLIKKEKTTGVAEWENLEHIYSITKGKIVTIHVSEGDKVEKGQLLFSINFDLEKESLEDDLKNLEFKRKELALLNENINKSINILNNNIEKEKNELFDKEEVSYIELERVKEKILKEEEKVKKEEDLYIKQKILFDAGVISEREINTALDTVKLAKDNLYQAKKDLEDVERKIDDKKTEIEKAEKKNNEDKVKKIEQILLDIDLKNESLNSNQLTKEKYDIEENNIRKKLEIYNNNVTIISPSNGVIDEIKVDKGQVIQENFLVATLGLNGSLLIKTQIPNNNNFISADDECKLSGAKENITGKVSQIKLDKDGKRIATVKTDSQTAQVGQNFDITFEKKYTEEQLLIPNNAVYKDNQGYMLYQIKERKGILGNEYYAEKIKISVGDSDDDNTIIEKGITFMEPIIISSTKPFKEGSTVQLKNEDELIVK